VQEITYKDVRVAEQSNKAIERGQRLRMVREALRLSRAALAEGCEVSASTVQSWEGARFGGLTESGAAILCRYFNSLGFKISLEWLFFGLGVDPLLASKNDIVATSAWQQPPTIREAVLKELRLFQTHTLNAIDLIVPDNALAPFIKKGDHVAGKRLFGDEIKQALGEIAIVQFVTGETLVRKLELGQTHYRFSDFAHDVELFSAAVVVWLRRLG